MTYWRGQGQTTASDRVRMSSSYLSPIDQFFAVLMRLKVGLFIQDIAERFQISSASFSMIFTTWISLLHAELKFLNPFPSKDIINRTMPQSFKVKYPSTRVIIDCTELFIQTSSSILNQSLTFSNTNTTQLSNIWLELARLVSSHLFLKDGLGKHQIVTWQRTVGWLVCLSQVIV